MELFQNKKTLLLEQFNNWLLYLFPFRYATSSTKTSYLVSLCSYMRDMHHFLDNQHTMNGFCQLTMSSSHHSR